MKSYAASPHSRSASFDTSLSLQEQSNRNALRYPPAGVYHQRSATVGTLPTGPGRPYPSPPGSVMPITPGRLTGDIYRRGLDALPSHPSAALGSQGILHAQAAGPGAGGQGTRASSGGPTARVLPPPPPSPLVLQREQIPLRGDRPTTGRLGLGVGRDGSGTGAAADAGGGRGGQSGTSPGHTAGAYSLGSGPKFQWVSTGDGSATSGHSISRSVGSSPFGLLGTGSGRGDTSGTASPSPPALHTTDRTGENANGDASLSHLPLSTAEPSSLPVAGGSVVEHVEVHGGQVDYAEVSGSTSHFGQGGRASGGTEDHHRSTPGPGGHSSVQGSEAVPAAGTQLAAPLPPNHEIVPSFIARLGWSAAAQDNLKAYLAAGGTEAAAVLASLLARCGASPSAVEVQGVVSWARGEDSGRGQGSTPRTSVDAQTGGAPAIPPLTSPAGRLSPAPSPPSPGPSSGRGGGGSRGGSGEGAAAVVSQHRSQMDSSHTVSTPTDRPVPLSMSPDAPPPSLVSAPSTGGGGEVAQAFYPTLPTGTSMGSPSAAQRPDPSTRPGFLPATVVSAWAPADPLAPSATHELPLPEGSVGQEVMVLHWEKEGWFYGRNSAGKEGWFPSSSVSLLAQPPPEHGVGVQGSAIDPATGERSVALTGVSHSSGEAVSTAAHPSSAPAPAPAPSAHLQALGRAIAGAIAKGPPPGYAESMAAQVEARAAVARAPQAGYGGYQDGYSPADLYWLAGGSGSRESGSAGGSRESRQEEQAGQEGAWDESEYGLGPAASAPARAASTNTATLPPQLVSPRTALRASPAVLQAIGEEEEEEQDGEEGGSKGGPSRGRGSGSAVPVPTYAHIMYPERSPPPSTPLPKITTRVVSSEDGVRVKVLALTGQELLHLWKVKISALGIFHALGQAHRARVRACKALSLGLCAARARTRVRDMAVSKLRGRAMALVLALGAMRHKAWLQAERAAAETRAKAAEEARAAAEAKAAAARAAKADMAAAPKLKGIHWDGLGEESLAGTIWALAKGDGVDLQALTSDLVDKFSAVQSGGGGGRGAGGKGGKGEGETPKEQLLSLVDAKTGKNLGILVAGFMGKRDVASVTAALSSLDLPGIGGLEKVQLLLANRGLWESEEMKPLREYTGDAAALVPPERVAKAILSVPGLIPKLQVCEFQATLPELVEALRARLELLLSASRELQTSRRFCTLLLDVILPLGNRLNASSKRPVSGFRISSLDKLMQTKASSGETFLQFVVHGLLSTAPTVLQLADDFPALLRTSPSALSKELMDGELKRLEAGVAAVDRLAKSPAIVAEGGSLQARLQAFLQEATAALSSMRSLHSEASEAFSTVCKWLGEDPTPAKISSYDDHLFKACRAFVLQVGKDARAMHERAEKARKAEERKAREDADKAARAARAAVMAGGPLPSSRAGASPPGSGKGTFKKVPGKSTMIQSPAAAAAAAARARAEARASGAPASTTAAAGTVKQLKRPASLTKSGSPPAVAASLQSTPPSSATVGSASSGVHRRSRDSRRSIGSRAGDDPLAAFQAAQESENGVDSMPGVTAVLSPAGSAASSRAGSPALMGSPLSLSLGLASPTLVAQTGDSSSGSDEETVMDQSAAVVGAALAEGLRMHRPRSLAEVVASSPEGTPPLASPPASVRLSLSADGTKSPIPIMSMLSPLSSSSSPSSSSPSPGPGPLPMSMRAAPDMSPERTPALHPGSAMAATRRSLVRAQSMVQSPGGSFKASGPMAGAFAPTPRGKAPSHGHAANASAGNSHRHSSSLSLSTPQSSTAASGQADIAMKAALELLHSGKASPEQLQQLAAMVGIDASLIRRLA